MRLLQYDNAGRVSFTKDLSAAELPDYRYAILSHTWGLDEEEVTYDDILNGTGTSKPGAGSEKIRFCIQQAIRDGLGYFWVDTCCIDKRNLVELSRALISMFRWYSDAEKCYAFLSDVANSSPRPNEEQRSKSWQDDFRSSRWFTRGWTLQELLAPRSLDFFSSDGYNLGTKASCGQVISEITHIPIEALHGQPLASFSIQERLSWQENRQTKEEEDMVYSLLGIFNVSMPVLYGEGMAQAQARLSALLQQPEMQPKPSSNVPFRRDPHFVERAALADQIRTRLAMSAGRVVLVGLGGIGKSQLAIEYARQLRQQSPETWVFWIHASSAARFEQSVRDVVDQLRLYGRKDPKADHLQLLQNWLRDESKGSWMMVLDNADDASFLVEPPTTADEAQPRQRRIDYIPSCDHGSVIITTRNKSEGLKLVYETEIVSVLPMSEAEAEALLVSKLGKSSTEDRRLVQALDCMPLAITQAAAYIRERGSRCSVQQYREEMERSRTARTGLLRRHPLLPNRDREASNSILLTWQISFEHVYKTQRSAAELLSLMSFCDRLAIPETLLYTDNGSPDRSAHPSSFEDDIVVLRSFSFVSETADSRSWEMHRLVQDAIQAWLKDCGRFNEIHSMFVHQLCASLPMVRFENWSSYHVLFPHAVCAAEQRPADGNAQIEWASVMFEAAWYALKQGAYDSALTMATNSQTVRLEHLDKDNEATLRSRALVAEIYREQGRWAEAERLFVKVMEAGAKLGPDHPDMLASMAGLALTYSNQGRWLEAEQLQVKVMEARAKLGPNHPDMLTSMADLALTYSNQGRWLEAEQLQVKVMEARAKLGPNHPDMLTSMADLALTYSNQGRWLEAEQLQVKVMEARAKLGPNHPDTLASMANLASTYRRQGRWEEAERLGVKVIETLRGKLGPDHPDTLTIIANLALTIWEQGRWEEAERLQVKVIETRKEKLGPDHPHTLNSIAHLALTYQSQERWEEAERLQVKVIEMRKEKLGPDHPDTLASINNLAVTYAYQERWAEAEDLQTQAVDGCKKSYGLQHPYTLKATRTLGSIQRMRGQR